MCNLYTQYRLIDYIEKTEGIFLLNELKNKLKSYKIDDMDIMNQIEKCTDYDDLDNVIDEMNDFYDDDWLELIAINPSVNHLLKYYSHVDKIVYLDNATHYAITDKSLIDMDYPVRSWDYQNGVLYVCVETESTSKYNKNYTSKQEAKNDGIYMVMKCRCDECGRAFWTAWRSKYSPAPMCEECQDPLFVTVESIEI